MKKHIIKFICFCVTFLLVLVGLYYFASPERMLGNIELANYIGQAETSKGTYVGNFLGSNFEKNGQFDFLSGEKYKGNWENCTMQGDGTILFNDIGTYVGEFQNSKRQGTGIFTWYDGDKYNGLWENDMMSGQGSYIFSNGGQIVGEFKENKIITGTYSYVDKNIQNKNDRIISWKSDIKDGKICGTVDFKTKNGLVYSGGVPNNSNSVNAEITYLSGNKYSGKILGSVRSGEGKYQWYQNGKSQAYYSGSWINDKMSGTGTYYYSESEYPKLSGTFENGKPTGTCVYYKSATESFDTTWVNGKCTKVKER